MNPVSVKSKQHDWRYVPMAFPTLPHLNLACVLCMARQLSVHLALDLQERLPRGCTVQGPMLTASGRQPERGQEEDCSCCSQILNNMADGLGVALQKGS